MWNNIKVVVQNSPVYKKKKLSNIVLLVLLRKFFWLLCSPGGDDGVVVEERITDGSVGGPWCSLPCRSIRIGNYKVRGPGFDDWWEILTICPIILSKLSQVLPKDKLTVTQRGIQFKVPGILPPQEVITITIGMNDVLKVLQSLFVCISKTLLENLGVGSLWQVHASPVPLRFSRCLR